MKNPSFLSVESEAIETARGNLTKLKGKSQEEILGRYARRELFSTLGFMPEQGAFNSMLANLKNRIIAGNKQDHGPERSNDTDFLDAWYQNRANRFIYNNYWKTLENRKEVLTRQIKLVKVFSQFVNMFQFYVIQLLSKHDQVSITELEDTLSEERISELISKLVNGEKALLRQITNLGVSKKSVSGLISTIFVNRIKKGFDQESLSGQGVNVEGDQGIKMRDVLNLATGNVKSNELAASVDEVSFAQGEGNGAIFDKLKASLSDFINCSFSNDFVGYLAHEVAKVDDQMRNLFTGKDRALFSEGHDAKSFMRYVINREIRKVKEDFREGRIGMYPLPVTRKMLKDLEIATNGRDNIGKAILIGGPGIGKSKVLEEYARMRGVDLHTVNVHKYYNYYEAIAEFSSPMGQVQSRIQNQDFRDNYLLEVEYKQGDEERTGKFKDKMIAIIKRKYNVDGVPSDDDIVEFFDNEFGLMICTPLNWNDIHEGWYRQAYELNEVQKFELYQGNGDVIQDKIKGDLIIANENGSDVNLDEIEKGFSGAGSGPVFLASILAKHGGEYVTLKNGERILLRKDFNVYGTANSRKNLGDFMESRFQMIDCDGISKKDIVLFIIFGLDFETDVNQRSDILEIADQILRINGNTELERKMDFRSLGFLINTLNKNSTSIKEAFYTSIEMTFKNHSKDSSLEKVKKMIESVQWKSETSKGRGSRINNVLEQTGDRLLKAVDVFNNDPIVDYLLEQINCSSEEDIEVHRNYSYQGLMVDDGHLRDERAGFGTPFATGVSETGIRDAHLQAKSGNAVYEFGDDENGNSHSNIKFEGKVYSITLNGEKACAITPLFIGNGLLVDRGRLGDIRVRQLDDSGCDIKTHIEVGVPYAFHELGRFAFIREGRLQVLTKADGGLRITDVGQSSYADANDIKLAFSKGGSDLLVMNGNKVAEAFSVLDKVESKLELF